MGAHRIFFSREEARTHVHVGSATKISPHGFWILVDGRELFLPFDEFPWFKSAKIEEIVELERPQLHHLRWPKLDVDLSLDSIEHPERYPLKSRHADPR